MTVSVDNEDVDIVVPRGRLDLSFLNDPEWLDFDEYDRSCFNQIEQNLSYLGEEKSRKVLKKLAKTKHYGL